MHKNKSAHTFVVKIRNAAGELVCVGRSIMCDNFFTLCWLRDELEKFDHRGGNFQEDTLAFFFVTVVWKQQGGVKRCILVLYDPRKMGKNLDEDTAAHSCQRTTTCWLVAINWSIVDACL